MGKRIVNPIKSAKVKAERGLSPEEVAEQGDLVAVLESKYPDQFLEIYPINKEAWVVVGTSPERFITCYQSRKHRKELLK